MKGQGKPLFEAIGPCPYCGGEPSLVTGAVLYPHRPDLAHKPFGRCAPCDATVGFHLDGRPLGTLAKPELRKLRGQAHFMFDGHWRNPNIHPRGTMAAARRACYRRLANELGIDVHECHFGEFREDRIRKAIEIMRTWKAQP